MDTLYLATSSRLKPARFTAENDSKASLARFLGNTDSSLHEYFILDILSLEEGRHIAPGDHRKAVVSREFAEMNGLELGDTVLASDVYKRQVLSTAIIRIMPKKRRLISKANL